MFCSREPRRRPRTWCWVGLLVALLGCEEHRAPECKLHCKQEGRCTLKAGECIVTLADDCLRSDACQVDGRCELAGQTCAASVSVCAARKSCHEQGACGVKDGV